ncbi:hypothetical protein KC330_g7108 [Hortaea werneckii]|nr:hypothetical protein KC330_g7108 [Hortaea werneckii]
MYPPKGYDPDCPPMWQNGSSPRPDSVKRDKGKGRADFGFIGQEREMLRQQRESMDDTPTGMPLNAATGALTLSGGRGRSRNVSEGDLYFGAQPHGTRDAAGNYSHYDLTSPTPYRGFGNLEDLKLSGRRASSWPINQWDLDGRNARLGQDSHKRDSSTDTVKTINTQPDAQAHDPPSHAQPEIIFPGRNAAVRQAQRKSSTPTSGGGRFATPGPSSSALRPSSGDPRTKSDKKVTFVPFVQIVPPMFAQPVPFHPQGYPQPGAQTTASGAFLQTPPQVLPGSNMGPAAWSSNSGSVTSAAEMQQLLKVTQTRIQENQKLIAKVQDSSQKSMDLIANLRLKVSGQRDRVGSIEHTVKALEEKIKILMATVNLMNVDRIRTEMAQQAPSSNLRDDSRAPKEASSGTSSGMQRLGSASYTPNPQFGAAPITSAGGRSGYQRPPQGGDNARQHPTSGAGRWTGSGGRPASQRPFQGVGRAPQHPASGPGPWTTGGGRPGAQRPPQGAGARAMPPNGGHGGMSMTVPSTADDVFAPGPSAPRETPKPEPAKFETKDYLDLIRAITIKTEASARAQLTNDMPTVSNDVRIQEVVRLAGVHLDSKTQAKVLLEDPTMMRTHFITAILNRWIAENIYNDDILSKFPGNTLSRYYLDAWNNEQSARRDVTLVNHLPYRLALATRRSNLAKTLTDLPGFWKWQQDYSVEVARKMVQTFLPLISPLIVDLTYWQLHKAVNEAVKTTIRMRTEPAVFECNFFRYGSRFDFKIMIHRNEDLIGQDCSQQPSPYVVRMTVAPQIVRKNFNGGNELTVDVLQRAEVWVCDRKTHLR